MWKILNIFDGDYGCEELKDGETPKVTLLLKMRTVTADFSA